MNGDKPGLQDACGCCDGIGIESPREIDNRPGLSEIAYRIGTHNDFLAGMRSRLSSKDYPALAGMRTRDSNDFTMALLDAYACMADVLGFYQERLANESYLRTATERFSLRELARLIGYRLRPGVAAETSLVFTLQEPPPSIDQKEPKQATGIPDTITLAKGMKVQSIPGPDEKPQVFETVESIEMRPDWNVYLPRMNEEKLPASSDYTIYLKGTTAQLKAGDTLLFVGEGRRSGANDTDWAINKIVHVDIDADAKRTKVLLEHAIGTVEYPIVYALRLRAAQFGYNAPDWKSLPNSTKDAYATGGSLLSDWPTGVFYNKLEGSDQVELDASYPTLAADPDSWMVLKSSSATNLFYVTDVQQSSRAEFSMSSKTTIVTLGGDLLQLGNYGLRETAVYAQSEQMTFAEMPITDDVTGNFLRIDRQVNELQVGRNLILSGTTTSGEEASEELTLLDVQPDGDASKIFFTSDLNEAYKRETVKVFANVVRATHGETINAMNQILGSGDGQKVHQRFDLKQAPLSFISASNELGASAELDVTVNDVHWHEVDTLYGAEAHDRSYVLRIGEDGAGTVQFGDGINGARLPTGQNNVRARYRKGIGKDGNLKAGQLSQLLSRPLGVKSVSNLLPSAGGVDADTAEAARQNMPLGVRTLGRVVSLRDYEDYARAYTGIAKAQVTVLNTQAGRTIFVTVAGDDGVIPSSDTLDHLLDAFKKYGDPLVHCEVAAYNKVSFYIGLKIKCKPDYDFELVKPTVEATLREAFSFSMRDFNQIVARSEVIAIVQQVDGVLGVDLDDFYKDPTVTDAAWLAPAPATMVGGTPYAAEILVLDDGPLISLEQMP